MDDKFFNRALELRVTIGILDQSLSLELGEQHTVGFHLEQICLLLEKASKQTFEDWAPTVCKHIEKIKIVDKSDAQWRYKLEEIVRLVAEKRNAEKGQTPRWLAYSLLENLAALRIFYLRRDLNRDKVVNHIIPKIYRLAEGWVFEDTFFANAPNGLAASH